MFKKSKKMLSLILVLVMILSMGVNALAASYTDVTEEDWSYKYVEDAAAKGIFLVGEDGLFDPNAELTRGMMVAALGRMVNVDVSAYAGKATFTDVSADKDYHPYVEWAAEKGVVQGYGNNLFGPEDLIIREDLAALIYNFAGWLGYSFEAVKEKVEFADSKDIAAHAVTAVSVMQQAGLIEGDGTGYFDPDATADKRAMAKLSSILSDLAIDEISKIRGAIGDLVLIPANDNFAFEKTLVSDTTASTTIEGDYYMDKYQVTVAEYAEFCKATGHAEPTYWANEVFNAEEKANHPVLYVAYSDAMDYCKWLNETNDDGLVYRLPTEAEWENAAKGYSHNTYPWGNDAPSYDAETDTLNVKHNFNAYCTWYLLSSKDYGSDYKVSFVGNYSKFEPTTLGALMSISATGSVSGWSAHGGKPGFNGCDLYKNTINPAGGTTWEVDSNPEGNSPYGLYNMAGNAWEWTQSVVRADTAPEKSKTGAAGYGYAVRGGAWYTTLGSTKMNYRGEAKKGASNTIGFRVAAEAADHAVYFYSNGVLSYIDGVKAGETVSIPTVLPVDNKYIVGWYTDAELTKEWNFATDKVTSDVQLYAKWADALENYMPVSANPNFAFKVDLASTNAGAGEAAPITESYLMSKYYITYGDWKAFCDATGRAYPENWTSGSWGEAYGVSAVTGETLYLPKLEDKMNHPIMYVGYTDITEYCEWYATQNPGWFFRLPTEAEWENAAKGGNDDYIYPWGNTVPTYKYNAETKKGEGTLYKTASYSAYMAANLIDLLGYDYELQLKEGGEKYKLGELLTVDGSFKNGTPYNWSTGSTKFTSSPLYKLWNSGVAGMSTAVGTFNANSYGLYDMTGNCWTLTSTHRPGVFGPEISSDCVAVRGGSFYAQLNSLTTSFRREARSITHQGNNTVGARLVAEPVGEENVVYYHITNSYSKGNKDNNWAYTVSDVGSTDLLYHRLLTNGGKAEDISATGVVPEYYFVQREATPSKNSTPFSVELITVDGWYTDEACTQKYDFSKPVTGALHLYAKYVDAGKTATYTASTGVLEIS